MEEENISFHVGSQIKKRLKELDRSVAWLAKNMPYDRGNLGRMLKKNHIPIDKLQRISKILNCNFFTYYYDDLQ